MCAGGRDYEQGPYYVTVYKGQMSADYCINITNDEELEFDEVFLIHINETSLLPGIVVVEPNKTTVTILDDECK